MTDNDPLLVLCEDIEINPGDAGHVVVRAALHRVALTTTTYAARLLETFAKDGGARVDEVLRAYPFQKAASRAFLEQALRVGLLREKDSGPSNTVSADPSIFAAPRFDPDNPAPFVVLGVPWDASTTGLPGARFGPTTLRHAAEPLRLQLDEQLNPVGFYDHGAGFALLSGIHIQDYGDIRISPSEPQRETFARVTDATQDILECGAIPVVIGGDHAITHPVLAAYNEPMVLFHIDAHTDLGQLGEGGARLHHGNVMSAVLEDFQHVEHIFTAGLRGLVDHSGGLVQPHHTRLGVGQLRREGATAVASLVDDDLPVYLTIDVDALDPSLVPSTGTPVPGGLMLDEVKALLYAVAKRSDVVGIDLVELGMAQGATDPSGPVALEVLTAAMDAVVTGMRARAATGAKQ